MKTTLAGSWRNGLEIRVWSKKHRCCFVQLKPNKKLSGMKGWEVGGKGKSDVILSWNCQRKDNREKRPSQALPKREFGKLGIHRTTFPPQNNSHVRKIICEDFPCFSKNANRKSWWLKLKISCWWKPATRYKVEGFFSFCFFFWKGAEGSILFNF